MLRSTTKPLVKRRLNSVASIKHNLLNELLKVYGKYLKINGKYLRLKWD